jgi:glutamate synthase (NADPH/NADH) large chain/glutamate synthase (ferredoxin)
MSGGEIIVRPKPEETFEWHTNCLVGNTCLYGATGGALFAAGWAGERFAVRNSGATAVVDGVGDHGCEYMTGGVVVVLSRIGKNFAAGMSGGLAFVHDQRGVLPDRHNAEMSSAERLTNNGEIDSLRRLIERHVEFTGSPYAKGLLENWETTISHFWKVLPHPANADTARAFLQFEALKVIAA